MLATRPEITQAMLKQHMHYDPESGVFTWKVMGRSRQKLSGRIGHLNVHGYVKVKFAGFHVAAHRLAWLYMHGQWPKGQLDHINGIRSDNRIANLREATPAQNKINTRPNKNTASGIKGVTKAGSRWQARCGLNGRLVFIGNFDTPEAAGRAYLEFTRKHYGEFSPTQLADKHDQLDLLQQTRIKAELEAAI